MALFLVLENMNVAEIINGKNVNVTHYVGQVIDEAKKKAAFYYAGGRFRMQTVYIRSTDSGLHTD